MMGRSGTRSTVNGMHIGSGLMAYAAGRAITDGVARAGALAAEDEARRIGQGIVLRARQQRRRDELVRAEADIAWLLAERKRIHGE